MRLIIFIIAIAASYFAYQKYLGQKQQNAFNDLVTTISSQPINQFDLKQSLNTQVTARCRAIGNSGADVIKMNDCLNTINAYRNECELQIFRLAPVEFETSDEAIDYGKRYQRCVLNNEFTNLVDTPKLL